MCQLAQNFVMIPVFRKLMCTLWIGTVPDHWSGVWKCLTRENRDAFTRAKQKEWASWLDKEAVELVKDRLKVQIPPIKGADALYIDPPSDLKRWLNLGPEDVLRLRKAVYGLINAPLRWHQRLSRALRQAGFVPLQMDPCIWILPSASPVKGVASVDVPTKLKAAVVDSPVSPVADSSVSPAADSSVSHVPEIRKARWKRQRNVLGVLGVHVDDFGWWWGILLFKKLFNGFGQNLNLEPGSKVDFDFVVESLSQEYNRKSIKISMSKFVQEMEPVAVPKHVKDDLDAPLETSVHSQFRGGVGQLQWL